MLWFAEKFVSLLIEQHLLQVTVPSFACCDLLKNSYLCLLNNTRLAISAYWIDVVICWKIRIFAYWTTPKQPNVCVLGWLWFAEKFVSLLIEQHREEKGVGSQRRCDLLKNSYLCLLNNTFRVATRVVNTVVICWKIRIFAYWTTPARR